MPNKKVSKPAVKKTVKPRAVPTKKLPFEKKKVKNPLKTNAVEIVNRPVVELVSFSVTAVIPTQQFGNIQPKIEVKASSFEQAVEFVKPMIKELYDTYAEVMPAFMKEKVTVEEKHVDVPAPESKPVQDPKAATSNTYTPDNTKPAASPVSENTAPPVKGLRTEPDVKDEAYVKGETAIAGASSLEALNTIESKVKNSTKIKEEDKPFLITSVLKKRKEFE